MVRFYYVEYLGSLREFSINNYSSGPINEKEYQSATNNSFRHKIWSHVMKTSMQLLNEVMRVYADAILEIIYILKIRKV